MRCWIKRVADVTVCDINLSPSINQRSDKVQIKLVAVGLDLIYPHYREDYIWALNGGKHDNG